MRELHVIGKEIRADWGKVYYGASPYLKAMSTMSSINDAYGLDTGDSVVRYFLVNAGTWRGETARRIKKELNGMLR